MARTLTRDERLRLGGGWAPRILAMATGAGKTISALVAAHRLLESNVPLAIVIAVPTKPL